MIRTGASTKGTIKVGGRGESRVRGLLLLLLLLLCLIGGVGRRGGVVKCHALVAAGIEEIRDVERGGHEGSGRTMVHLARVCWRVRVEGGPDSGGCLAHEWAGEVEEEKTNSNLIYTSGKKAAVRASRDRDNS